MAPLIIGLIGLLSFHSTYNDPNNKNRLARLLYVISAMLFVGGAIYTIVTVSFLFFESMKPYQIFWYSVVQFFTPQVWLVIGVIVLGFIVSTIWRAKATEQSYTKSLIAEWQKEPARPLRRGYTLIVRLENIGMESMTCFARIARIRYKSIRSNAPFQDVIDDINPKRLNLAWIGNKQTELIKKGFPKVIRFIEGKKIVYYDNGEDREAIRRIGEGESSETLKDGIYVVDIEILRLNKKDEPIKVKTFSKAIKLQDETLEWQDGVYDDKKNT